MTGKQEQFKREDAVGSGKDENGEYNLIPLSMVKGGQTTPFKVYRHPLMHIVNDSNPTPRGWYKNKHEPNRVRPRPCYSEALLTTPYGGYCPVSCAFCYVDHGTRGYRATGLPTVSPTYPDQMKKQLANMMITGPAYMSSFTEPFHELEKKYHNVERLTDIFIEENVPFFYLSRKIPPDWAIDALQASPYSYMQWSVNTSKTEVYRKLSPGSYTIEDWLKSVEKMAKQGIYISIQVNPVLPGIVTLDDLKDLIKLGAEAGVDHFIFKFAEQVFNNRKMLIDRLAGRKLAGVDLFDSLLTQRIGGVYTVEQDTRITWLNELLTATRSNDVTMSTCYEYYDNGKAGASLAPWYTTSDQCHGRGVPVHYRPEPGAKFRPLPGCFRKGCLYCEDYGTKACGNETLLQAKMLTYKDFKEIRLEGNKADWKMDDSCTSPKNTNKFVARNPELLTDAELYDMEWPG